MTETDWDKREKENNENYPEKNLIFFSAFVCTIIGKENSLRLLLLCVYVSVGGCVCIVSVTLMVALLLFR